MSAEDTVRILLARGTNGREPLDPKEWKRVKGRAAWVRETLAALLEAQQAMDDRCGNAVDRVPEDEFNRIFDEEQAKVDAIRAQIDAVIERDEWPKHLHFGGI